METRLKPIEKPGFMMSLVYAFSKKQFGKVLSPLSVLYSRLPFSFALATQKFSKLSKKLSIGKDLELLVQIRVSQINVCSFCMDIAKSMVIRGTVNENKVFELENFRESALFTPAEKAALQFVEELTRDKKVSDETFENAKRYFNERQLVEIGWTVSVEHYYNMLNIAFNIESDNLCDARMKKPVAYPA